MRNQTKITHAFSTLRLFLRAIALTWQANRILALLTLLLLLFSAFISPLQVWISKLMIDGVTTTAGQGITAANAPAIWQSLLLRLAFYIGVWTLGQITMALDRHVRGLMAMQVDYSSPEKFFPSG